MATVWSGRKSRGQLLSVRSFRGQAQSRARSSKTKSPARRQGTGQPKNGSDVKLYFFGRENKFRVTATCDLEAALRMNHLALNRLVQGGTVRNSRRRTGGFGIGTNGLRGRPCPRVFKRVLMAWLRAALRVDLRAALIALTWCWPWVLNKLEGAKTQTRGSESRRRIPRFHLSSKTAPGYGLAIRHSEGRIIGQKNSLVLGPISRILSAARLMHGVIFISLKPSEDGQSPCCATCVTHSGMRLTRDYLTGRQVPYLVLHRSGFFVPPSLLSARWALTPPLHPLP